MTTPFNQTHFGWASAVYPWDNAECSNCLTGHGIGMCCFPGHEAISEAASATFFPKPKGYVPNREDAWYQAHISKALELRQRFAHLYPAQGDLL